MAEIDAVRKAGRPKGALNKVTADIKVAAQQYTGDALKVLAQIMKTGESEAARVAAANSILDRGYGRPKQSVDVEANVNVKAVEWRVVDPTPERA